MNKNPFMLLMLICLFIVACRLSDEIEVPLTAIPEPSPTAVVHIATSTSTPAPLPVEEPEIAATNTAVLPTTEPETAVTKEPIPSPTAPLDGTDWQAGPLIDYRGIQFSLDSALGEGVFIYSFTPGVEFSHSPVTNFCHRQPFCIRAYDTQAFDPDSRMGFTIDWVAQLIIGEQESLPTRGAAFLIQTQTRQIPLQNGTGVRAVTMVGQNGYPAYNDAVYYEFHGLTDDGRFYIVIDIQIDHPLLLDNQDPEQNQRPTALLPRESVSPSELEAIARYNRLVEAELQGQLPDSFIPSLTLLDELVASLLISADAFTLESE